MLNISKNYTKRSIVAVIILVFLVFTGQTYGDTGNNVDYDSNGGVSSSMSDTYSDAASGRGSSDGIMELIIYLLLSALPLPIKIIVIVGLMVFYFILKKNNSKEPTIKHVVQSRQETIDVEDNTKEIERVLREYDSNFSTGKFLGWAEEVYMTIQQAWSTRDWAKIRSFEKEELYRKHELQLQEYKNNGTINIVERVNVNQTYLYDYVRDKEYEYLRVYLQARINDYIIDENTREVVRGDKFKEYHMRYILTFMRKTGVLTDGALSNLSTKQCPHCGAPLAITSAGKCEYCDTIVTTGEFDWVLSDIDSIKDNTNLGPGGVNII